MAAMNGVVSLVIMGGMTSMLKDALRGRDTDMDIDEFMLKGIAQSGLLGLVGTTVLDVSMAAMDPKQKLYLGDRVASAALGPSVSQISGMTKVLQKLTDGDVTSKDVNAASRMVPFMNLFYLRILLDQAFKE